MTKFLFVFILLFTSCQSNVQVEKCSILLYGKELKFGSPLPDSIIAGQINSIMIPDCEAYALYQSSYNIKEQCYFLVENDLLIALRIEHSELPTDNAHVCEEGYADNVMKNEFDKNGKKYQVFYSSGVEQDCMNYFFSSY